MPFERLKKYVSEIEIQELVNSYKNIGIEINFFFTSFCNQCTDAIPMEFCFFYNSLYRNQCIDLIPNKTAKFGGSFLRCHLSKLNGRFPLHK